MPTRLEQLEAIAKERGLTNQATNPETGFYKKELLPEEPGLEIPLADPTDVLTGLPIFRAGSKAAQVAAKAIVKPGLKDFFKRAALNEGVGAGVGAASRPEDPVQGAIEGLAAQKGIQAMQAPFRVGANYARKLKGVSDISSMPHKLQEQISTELAPIYKQSKNIPEQVELSKILSSKSVIIKPRDLAGLSDESDRILNKYVAITAPELTSGTHTITTKSKIGPSIKTDKIQTINKALPTGNMPGEVRISGEDARELENSLYKAGFKKDAYTLTEALDALDPRVRGLREASTPKIRQREVLGEAKSQVFDKAIGGSDDEFATLLSSVEPNNPELAQQLKTLRAAQAMKNSHYKSGYLTELGGSIGAGLGKEVAPEIPTAMQAKGVNYMLTKPGNKEAISQSLLDALDQPKEKAWNIQVPIESRPNPELDKVTKELLKADMLKKLQLKR